jgi:hypothetical protein
VLRTRRVPSATLGPIVAGHIGSAGVDAWPALPTPPLAVQVPGTSYGGYGAYGYGGGQGFGGPQGGAVPQGIAPGYDPQGSPGLQVPPGPQPGQQLREAQFGPGPGTSSGAPR